MAGGRLQGGVVHERTEDQRGFFGGAGLADEFNPRTGAGGVDRAADIQIVRANGKRKALPAQAINWSDVTTLDRVIGWRYAPAGGEARIHTPGETVPAPDV
jgi:hypothetical protein